MVQSGLLLIVVLSLKMNREVILSLDSISILSEITELFGQQPPTLCDESKKHLVLLYRLAYIYLP